MSYYCHYRDMDSRCELYCFESEAGYETHVAGTRIVSDIAPMRIGGNEREVRFGMSQYFEAIRNAERAPITLPYAGEQFIDPDLDSLEERLRELRKLGYRMPSEMFLMIWSDMAEERTKALWSEEKLAGLIWQIFPTLPQDGLLFAKLKRLLGGMALNHSDSLYELLRQRGELRDRVEVFESAAIRNMPPIPLRPS